MKKVSFLIVLAAATLSGCTASIGNMPQATQTNVVLSEDNYEVVKTRVKGTDKGFSLFGLIPIVSPTYADAKNEMYKSMGESLEGRAVGLANQTHDRSARFFVLFSITDVTVTADLIEFDAATE